jgi:hypothetical protein
MGMSTAREDLIQQIIDLETRKANLARRALACESAGEFDLADQCDAWWNAASDEIGKLMQELAEIDDVSEAGALREARLDREYGAWMTGP